MRNKKIIALICALAMIFSLFTSISVNADGNQAGIILETAQTTKTEAKITVKYDATVVPGGITGANIVLSLPSGATVDEENGFTKPLKGTYTPNVSLDGQVTINWYTGEAVTPEDGIITVITVTLPELSSDFKATLQNESFIGNDDVQLEIPGNLAAATTTIKADPNATPAPEPIDKPAIDNTAEKPTGGKAEVVPDPVNGGIALSAAKTAKGADITVKYEGFEGGITGANIVLSLPSGATVDEENGFTKPLKGTYTPNVSLDGQVTINWYTGEAVTPEDKVITVISVEYPEGGLAEDFVANLLNESFVGNDDAQLEIPGNLNATTVTLPASVEDERETVALKDKITPDEVKTAVDNATDKANTYLAIEAKKGNDPANYGTDYEAYYNGEKLTEAQLNNLLAGKYANDAENPITLEDVAKGLTFKYNNGVNIKMQLVADGEVAAEKTTETGSTPATPTPKPTAAPTMSIAVTSGGKAVTSVEVKSIVTVTVNVPAAVQVEGAKLDKDLVLDHADYLELIASTVNDNTAEYKYQAVKAGNVKITANYVKETVKTAAEDTTTTTTKETVASANTSLKITAAKSTGGGSSSSSSSSDKSTSSGGGAIATGLVDVGGTGNLFGFTDMGDASWATDAVNALAARKIVSGVGDNQFDPNGALTRAAYAQMLINAIGHNTDSADTEFADVPTDAWFYHNVAVAAQLGIVSGYGDGNFGPYDLITREQMALMTQKASVVMAKSLVGADAGTFTDDADIADWSRDAVYQLANAGIINGMGDGTFAPKANATRAQAAVIIYNTFVK